MSNFMSRSSHPTDPVSTWSGRRGRAFTSSNPSGGSMTIRLPSASIVVQISAASGISTSSSPDVDDQAAAAGAPFHIR